MTLAQQYATALQQAGGTSVHLAALRASLRRRGREQLLSAILSEYQKLLLKNERLAMHRRVTPEVERTRVLLELYRTLVTSK